jgi:gamma-D-glutamyl-L-lysine dipeptidyl-peptidase
MEFAICTVPVSPMRKEPDHRSEQTSQLLFGETCTIISQNKDWLQIHTLYDDYQGWITKTHVSFIDQPVLDMTCTHFACEWSNTISVNKQDMQVPFGCMIPGLVLHKAKWLNVEVEYKGELQKLSSKNLHHHLEAFAFMYMNSPYLWGGKTVYGIDCSGFTQQVFKLIGVKLFRDAQQQASQGEVIGFLPQCKSGDLAFFDNEAGEIIHVGILLNEKQIIHAAGKVRIDHIDIQGIINSETFERTHQLRLIKRVFTQQ